MTTTTTPTQSMFMWQMEFILFSFFSCHQIYHLLDWVQFIYQCPIDEQWRRYCFLLAILFRQEKQQQRRKFTKCDYNVIQTNWFSCDDNKLINVHLVEFFVVWHQIDTEWPIRTMPVQIVMKCNGICWSFNACTIVLSSNLLPFLPSFRRCRKQNRINDSPSDLETFLNETKTFLVKYIYSPMEDIWNGRGQKKK